MSDRDDLLAAIDAGYSGAESGRDSLNTQIDWLITWKGTASESAWRNNVIGALGKASHVLGHLIHATEMFIGGSFAVPIFLRDHTGATEITWKSIIRAWTDAPIGGVMWTIDEIDNMRKYIWDESPLIMFTEDPFE